MNKVIRDTQSSVQRSSVCEEFQSCEPGAQRRRLRGPLGGPCGPALAPRGVLVQYGGAAMQIGVNEALTSADMVDPS